MKDLSEIRDQGPFAARYSSKGALLPELFLILAYLKHGHSISEAKEKVKKREILTHRSYANRVTIWNHLNRRCLSLDPAILSSFLKASDSGITSSEFKSLAYLYYVLRDKLTYSVVSDLIWRLWQEKKVSIQAQNIENLINEYSNVYPEVARWRESTRKTLSRNLVAALRDFGLLFGENKKSIQQPTISDVTIFHLLNIQLAEGLMGNQIIESNDWRLFLWDIPTVSHNLSRLAMNKWIGFEKSGETVMIEMRRKVGEFYE